MKLKLSLWLINPLSIIFGNTNQHDVMPYLLEEITFALWKMNGEVGSINDYLYWAHLTLNSVKYDPNFSQDDLNDLKEVFDSKVVVPYNDQNNFGC